MVRYRGNFAAAGTVHMRGIEVEVSPYVMVRDNQHRHIVLGHPLQHATHWHIAGTPDTAVGYACDYRGCVLSQPCARNCSVCMHVSIHALCMWVACTTFALLHGCLPLLHKLISATTAINALSLPSIPQNAVRGSDWMKRPFLSTCFCRLLPCLAHCATRIIQK